MHSGVGSTSHTKINESTLKKMEMIKKTETNNNYKQLTENESDKTAKRDPMA